MCITGKNFQFWFESPLPPPGTDEGQMWVVVVEGMGGVEASN